MKFYNVAMLSIVLVTVFTCGLLVIGESAYISGENAKIITDGVTFQESTPTFNEVKGYNKSMYDIEDALDNNIFAQKNVSGQSAGDSTYEKMGFWQYTGLSFDALDGMFGSIPRAKGAIGEVLNYLKINPIIISAIILFFITGMGFAVLTWWKGRKP